VDTLEVLHLEHKDEPHKKDEHEQLHGTATTRNIKSLPLHLHV
jgi:hypothetical protein